MHLNPAEFVIHIFKGVRATARAIGRTPTAISKWRRPRDQGGTGGEIPRAARLIILQVADELGFEITSHDLDYGREIDAP